MNTKDFRAAVFGAIQTWGAASFPTLPIVWENGPVPDEDQIGPMWLDVEIRWYGGKSLGIGNVVSGRHSGVVSAQVFTRSAQGTGVSDDVIDSLETLLKNQRMGTAVLSFPQRTVSTDFRGWHKTGILVPFTLDR